MADYYLWVKAAHIIAVISWMAGLLYMPRLYVYHSRTQPGSESSELFKIMEARLARAIMLPAMIAAWLLGLMLVWINGWDLLASPWFMVKLAAVIALSGFNDMLMRYRRAFAADERPRSERYFRIINEVPAVLMIVIVAMVIVKPF